MKKNFKFSGFLFRIFGRVLAVVLMRSKWSSSLTNRVLNNCPVLLRLFLTRYVLDELEVYFPVIWVTRIGKKSLCFDVCNNFELARARYWQTSTMASCFAYYAQIIKEINKNGLCLDIGSNYGMHGFYFAVHGFDTICVEPQAKCLEYIEEVKKLNSLNCLSVMQAVVTRTGVDSVKFYEGGSTFYSSLHRSSVENFESSKEIECKSLSIDAISENGKLQVAFIKIDVEGEELNVLYGARETIFKQVPEMFVEIKPDHELRRKIFEFLMPFGYIIYEVRSDWRNFYKKIADLKQFKNTDVMDFAFVKNPSIEKFLSGGSVESL